MENEKDSFTVIISDKAKEMLIDHARFLANVSEMAANNFIEDFINSAKTLETFPERNPWLNEISLPTKKYRKIVFSKRYLMIYQVKQYKVFVDYIVDCRQNNRWL